MGEPSARSIREEGQRLLQMPARELLLVLGSILAIVLGPLFFILEVAIGGFGLGGLTAVIIAVVLGFLMLVSVGVMRRTLLTGLLLALISSVLLIGLGGTGGLIGGLFGLVGSLLTLATHYQEFLK